MTAVHTLTRRPSPAHQAAPGSTNTVKTPLTPNSRKPVVENDAYGAFARRVLRAYARRIADGDIDALPLMTALAADLDTAITGAVAGLRAFGYSWADIATRLGITRQAAWQRWGSRPS